MQHSETFSAIAAALATAQGLFPTIPRDRKVTVKLRGRDGQPGGQYDFHYAPLETILEKVRKPLADNGLALVQSIVLEDNGSGGAVEVLRTTLLHESGEWFANDVPIFTGTGDNKSQAYASGVTYSRRYGVTMLLCVAADEDDDGNGGDQDGHKPDYERTEGGGQYRGSFPRGGGQQRQGPKPPQRRSATAPLRRDDDDTAGELAGTGEVEGQPLGQDAELWGADLSGGQVSMLRAAALAGGFDDAKVRELVGGPITAANFREAQSKLKAAVNAQLAD